MSKWEVKYQAGYSARLERMHSTILGRLDKTASGIQFLAGMTVFADLASTRIAGAVMAVLSVATFIWQPGNKAAAAENQAKQYQSLYSRIETLSVVAARQEFAKIQESDSAVLGALCHAAEYGELIRLGADLPFKLTIREKCLAWLAGDLPKSVARKPT